MGYVRVRLRPGVSDPLALEVLRQLGLHDEAVVTDEAGSTHIFGALPDQALQQLDHPPLFFMISEAMPFDPSVDWDKQWASSGANYRQGHVFLDLDHQRFIRLKPGPGFGDLSHPTTRLVIELMRGNVDGRHVVDFGSGSGVLSLAAVGLGAHSALGVEIDSAAILHARENALLNEMQDRVTFIDPSDTDIGIQPDEIYLMNMIPADQEAIIAGLGLPTPLLGTWFVSGVLAEKRDEYLRAITERGWQLVRERKEAGWLGFHFATP